MREVVRKLHRACKHNDIQHVRDILKSFTIDDLNKAEKYEKTTGLNIASYHGYHEIVRLLLEHGDFMTKRNQDGFTPFSQAKDQKTKEIFSQYQRVVPRFAGDLLEWTVAYREPAIKRAQIRQYLAHIHFISGSFARISYRYVGCYLALEGFSTEEIDQLESIGYTSTDGFICAYTSTGRFHKYINRHLATYALTYFDSSFHISTPYSFIYCLLSIVAMILNDIRLRTSFIGHIYRGMLMTQEDLYKYVVDSRILNTAFLSTSKNRTVAEIFAGIKEYEISSTQDSTQINVLCIYRIRNQRTAYDIEQLSNIQAESEVLIFPFSAFHVTRVQKTSCSSVEIDLEECDEENWSDNSDA
ncbi:unnamed protein product [Rotaria sp. Silwood2]|nr:unnamed protein product [Rotaria sp. Silwood2]CAF3024231.1 unnamed protein product [Rotaria sp. Silwood2]CAF3112522.1 unnamed protein product [Rotaria sp. Silwood2]CAF3353363.1 unnamed protein product [Rotaria sp. Silwood2]CAF4187218.1 unnamed protein product [Rotaria sp. Silwood2]